MRRNTEALIDNLAGDLIPVTRLASPETRTIGWLGFTVPLVSIITAISGPWHPEIFSEAVGGTKFLLLAQTVLGVIVGVVSAYSAVSLAIPGTEGIKAKKFISLGLFGLWVSLFVYALFDPNLNHTLYGERTHCSEHIYAFSLIPFAVLFVLLQRAAPLETRWCGLLVGIAACSIPATFMQVSCLFVPLHILVFHIVPVLVFALAASSFCNKFLPKI